MRHFIYTITFILWSTFTLGQEKIPKISGTIKISLEHGTLDCDFTLSDYSHLNNYVIRLNKGLNILNIESLEPQEFLLGYERQFTDSIQTDETVGYYFPASNKNEKFLPSKLRFKYMGKFPVINDTLTQNSQRGDWRGNIAFKDSLLRLEGLQTAWYPSLYDVDKDYQYDSTLYDIEVSCEDCDMLYMSGSEPVKGSKARFKSDIPREPYLFVGKYKVQEAENITVLNADFSQHQLEEFDEFNAQVIDYFSEYTNLPYKEKVYWVQAYNTTKDTGYFAFASSPTFTLCGNYPSDLKSSFKKNLQASFGTTIAHEISHYYFGSLKKTNSNLETILNEGFAQFFAFKYWDSLENMSVEQEILHGIEWLEEPGFKFAALLDFNSASDTNDRETFAYDYQPAVLFSIEKAIGPEKMQDWIRLLLQGEEPLSNKDFFKSTLSKAINDPELYNKVIQEYLTGNSTLQNMKKLWEGQ